jgi:O-antigen ligase
METSNTLVRSSVAERVSLHVSDRTYARPSHRRVDKSSSAHWSFVRGMTPELWLILLYIVSATVGDLKLAKLNVHLGPVPIFYTDFALLFLLILSFLRSPARVLYWVSTGTGAAAIGRAAWILCLLAVVYCALAVGQYHLGAVEDLAIFGYCLFFPLTYFAIRDRRDASTLLRCFVYAGVVLALLVVSQYVIGGVRGHMALVDGVDASVYKRALAQAPHSSLALAVLDLRNEDDGAFATFALAALCGFIILEARWRRFHVLCAIACFAALAVSTSRATVVGLALAAGATFICLGRRYRLRYALGVIVCGVAVMGSSALSEKIPGVDLMRGLRVSVVSALGGPEVDANAEFRLRRWRYAADLWLEQPLLGAGFGRPIIPAGLIDANEGRGDYNAGMPHNTFLFLAVRAGMLGLGVVLFCWLQTLKELLGRFRRAGGADELASLNILVAMFGFAMFVLFFERPVTNATFWIMAAIGTRLAQCGAREAVWVRRKP